MNKTLKLVLNIGLTIIIIVLAILVYNSIMRPVHFKRINDARRAAVISNLKDIRDIQRYYKMENVRYAKNFDELLRFAEQGEIPIVSIVPDPTDTTNTRSIKDTIGYVSVKDSLFKNRTNFNLENLAIIPYSNNVEFEMDVDSLDRSGVVVYVFEARAHNNTFLTKDMEEYKQEVFNLNSKLEQIDRYPGLKVGSLKEVSTDGNWE
ncbi:MAG: hypothetical protein LBH92_06395 [Bacteroidales bacterium]|jgi:uncharacterized protein YpmB|nr:hypothetical protein [Bacteroidales bacterium]